LAKPKRCGVLCFAGRAPQRRVGPFAVSRYVVLLTL
jgi:hypothetical protein